MEWNKVGYLGHTKKQIQQILDGLKNMKKQQIL